MRIRVGDVYTFNNDNYPGIKYIEVVSVTKKEVEYILFHPAGKFIYRISRYLFSQKPDHLTFIRHEKESV